MVSQKGSSGSIVITVEPSVVDSAFFGTQVYMKAHFMYKPENDRLIPSREAGLPFDKGDVLEVCRIEPTCTLPTVLFAVTRHNTLSLLTCI